MTTPPAREPVPEAKPLCTRPKTGKHPRHLERRAVDLLQNYDLMLGEQALQEANASGTPSVIFVQNCPVIARDHADAADVEWQDAWSGDAKDAALSRWSCRRSRCLVSAAGCPSPRRPRACPRALHDSTKLTASAVTRANGSRPHITTRSLRRTANSLCGMSTRKMPTTFLAVKA